MIVVEVEGGHFPNGLILTSLFWAALFGFFFYNKSDDDSTCFVSTGDDLTDSIPIVEEDSVTGTVDVAERFHLFFMVGFYLSLG